MYSDSNIPTEVREELVEILMGVAENNKREKTETHRANEWSRRIKIC